MHCQNHLEGLLKYKLLGPAPTSTQKFLGFLSGSDGKESACNAGDHVQSLGWEDFLEKEMATHSSILAWRIPWKEKPGGL